MKYYKVYYVDLKFTDEHMINNDMYSNKELDASGISLDAFQIRVNANSKSKSTDWVINDGDYSYIIGLLRPEYKVPLGNLKILSDIDGSKLQDKTLYRYPKLALPRTKLDILKEKYNISVKRDPNVADYKIISENIFNTMSYNSWDDFYTLENLQNLIERFSKVNGMANITQAGIDKLLKFYNYLNTVNDLADESDNYEVLIVISKSHEWLGYQVVNPYDNFIKSFEHVIHRGVAVNYAINLATNAIDVFNLINSDNLILDSKLVELSTEDSVIIDEDSYENLYKMFSSQDTENYTIALELMANCNVEKSYDKIALLFFFFQFQMKYASNWNSINVKSLKKRFSEKYAKGYDFVRSYGYDLCIKNLAEDNHLTEFAFQHLAAGLLKRCINGSLGLGRGDNAAFTIDVSAIKLTTKYSKLLKQKDQSLLISDLPF